MKCDSLKFLDPSNEPEGVRLHLTAPVSSILQPYILHRDFALVAVVIPREPRPGPLDALAALVPDRIVRSFPLKIATNIAKVRALPSPGAELEVGVGLTEELHGASGISVDPGALGDDPEGVDHGGRKE